MAANFDRCQFFLPSKTIWRTIPGMEFHDLRKDRHIKLTAEVDCAG